MGHAGGFVERSFNDINNYDMPPFKKQVPTLQIVFLQKNNRYLWLICLTGKSFVVMFVTSPGLGGVRGPGSIYKQPNILCER